MQSLCANVKLDEANLLYTTKVCQAKDKIRSACLVMQRLCTSAYLRQSVSVGLLSKENKRRVNGAILGRSRGKLKEESSDYPTYLARFCPWQNYIPPQIGVHQVFSQQFGG